MDPWNNYRSFEDFEREELWSMDHIFGALHELDEEEESRKGQRLSEDRSPADLDFDE